MSDKDKDHGEYEDRGGKKDGGTPDYEKRQSSPQEDKNFDHEKTKW